MLLTSVFGGLDAKDQLKHDVYFLMRSHFCVYLILWDNIDQHILLTYEQEEVNQEFILSTCMYDVSKGMTTLSTYLGVS